ncbi:MAG: carboxypeptidase-like regulatory domain-containing protein, partial [Acidobacteriota bacterium]
MRQGVIPWRRAAFHILASCTLLLAAIGSIGAQQSIASATLSGLVEDANGAAIKGASIEATNRDTKLEWSATTDKFGRFRFLYLPVGNYSVHTQAAGFSRSERDLTLSVGQALELTLQLQVSDVAARIDVSSETPVVETVRTQLSQTVQLQEIDALPLNGRNYLDLAALT